MNEVVEARRTSARNGVPPPPGEPIPDEVDFPVGPIRFRAAVMEDVPALLEAARRAFPGWPPYPTSSSDEDYIRWFIDSWSPEQRLTWVGVHGDRVAAFGLGYSRPTWLQGRLMAGSLGAFGAVDPDYRRMYLYNWFRAWRTQNDGREVALSFTQVEAIRRTQSHVGDYRPVANELGVFARIFRPLDASGRGGLERLKRAPGYLALQAAGLLRRRPAPRVRWKLREVRHFDGRVEALDEACAAEFDLLPQRSHQFLNWRYFDPRTGPSIGIIAEEGDALVGYAVLRKHTVRAHIADLLVAPGRTDVVRSLIDACVRRAQGDGRPAIECTLPEHHPYMPALRSAGFARLGARSREVARKFNVASWHPDPHLLDFLADPHARIHVMIGDSDLV